ncbi:MAG: baseplate J/gp47 family protein [Lysinibacillus sp.]
MFEDRTAENILNDMLSDIPNDIDKRKGSIIYDALAPTAFKLAEMYSDLDVFLDLVFADTATDEHLARRTAELGVYKKMATAAIRKGTFVDTSGNPMSIFSGAHFTLDSITFEVVEEINTGEYKLKALTAGTVGNKGVGAILPTDPIISLGTATITDVLMPGTDDELDENLYARYQIRTRRQATSGNAAHYEEWALSVAGVGAAKIIPVWNGPNTVEVIILGEDKEPVTQGILDTAYNYIENERPIGAIVTVTTAAKLVVNVSATLALATGATIETVKFQFKEGLETYLKSVAFVTNELTNEPELIRYNRIASILLDLPQILDFADLKVNGGTSNIQPTAEQVCVMGNVVFT